MTHVHPYSQRVRYSQYEERGYTQVDNLYRAHGVGQNQMARVFLKGDTYVVIYPDSVESIRCLGNAKPKYRSGWHSTAHPHINLTDKPKETPLWARLLKMFR